MIFLLLCCVVLLASSEVEVLQNNETIEAVKQNVIVQVDGTIQTTLVAETLSETNISTPQEDKVTSVEKEVITITNNITPEMLNYKHWTGTYSPEKFTISVNNTKVTAGESYTFTKTNDPLVINFDYSFMNGMRKGGKKISYTMHENSTTASLSFSWSENHKVIIDNATPLSIETT